MCWYRSFGALWEVKWLGDNKIPEFLNRYHTTLSTLQKMPDEESLRQNLYDKMRATTNQRLMVALQLYEALAKEEQTHEKLMTMLQDHCERELQDANNVASLKATENMWTVKGPGAAARPKPNAKGKAEAKTKKTNAATSSGGANPGKPENKGKGGKGTRSGSEGATPKLSGYCFDFLEGKCELGNKCSRDHPSEKIMERMALALSKGAFPSLQQQLQHSPPTTIGKGGRGSGRGRGRGSGGKGGKSTTRSPSTERKAEEKAPTKGSKGGGRNPQGKAAPAAAAPAEREKELEKRLSRPKWCIPYLAGSCNKSPCTFPHLDAGSVEQIKAAREAERKERKAVAAATRAASTGPQQ